MHHWLLVLLLSKLLVGYLTPTGWQKPSGDSWNESGVKINLPIIELDFKDRLPGAIQWSTKIRQITSETWSEKMLMTPRSYGRSCVLHCTLVLASHESKKGLADRFVTFFSDKIAKIRNSFSSSDSLTLPPPPDVPNFSCFKQVSQEEIRKIIMKSPTKSCLLDPWPTFHVKECIDILQPSITRLVNCSLSEGVVPDEFKKAIVTPLIKKSSLPPNDLKNYRPVSGLGFISKLVERVVASQLNDHVSLNGLENVRQSAYKLGQSTESALLSIKNDVHLAFAKGEATAVVLLDQSAAFDTIDHDTLLNSLSSWFGVSRVVLDWFKSYLSDRVQCIKIGSILSDAKKLLYGVPQGSVLGPIFFSIYTTPLCKVIRNHPGISFQFYADDTQLYVHLTHKNVASALDKLSHCLEDVKRRLSTNKLKLNPDKTEFIVFGSKSQREKLNPFATEEALFWGTVTTGRHITSETPIK